MSKPRVFPGFTARTYPWWTSLVLSFICGFGGLTWGWDYIEDHGSDVPIDDNLVSVGLWGWAFIVIGGWILLAMAAKWIVGRRHYDWADRFTLILTVSHVFGLALCSCAFIAVTWANIGAGTGERVAFSLLTGAVLNGLQVVRVPTELHRIPASVRRFAVWLR